MARRSWSTASWDSFFAVASRPRIEEPGRPSASASPRAISTAMPAERTYCVTLSCSSRAIRCRSPSTSSRWWASSSRSSTWRSSAVRSARLRAWAVASSYRRWARRCRARPAWYCSEVCSETAAWLARMRSTDRSPGSGSTCSRCWATRLPTLRPSSVIGTRIQPDGSMTGRVWPARIDCSSSFTEVGRSDSSTVIAPSPSEARNRGRAPLRWPSDSASTVHSAFRCAAAARTTSSSSPRGPSTVRTRAREMESIARTASCIRSSERTKAR